MRSNAKRRGPRRRALVAGLAAAALALASLAPSATAQSSPKVLETDPYYLALHEGRGEHRGTVLTLHGGGWRGDFGERADELMAEWIRTFTSWGYDVANLGYRGGTQSLDDALSAFDRLREDVGPDERLCAFGGSAGAQLALMIAARRGSEIDCVLDFLGPPDLEEWGAAPAAGFGLRLATEAFGEARLAELSPINNVDAIDAPVLVAAAPCDIFIDLAGQRRFVEALNAAGGDARLQVITTGEDVSIGHCAAREASYKRFEDAARSFLAGRSADAVEATEDESGMGFAAVLAAAVVVAGVALLLWSLRRRA